MPNKKTKQHITLKKLESYIQKTEQAVGKAQKKINKDKNREAGIILDMVKNYIADCKYFRENGDLVRAFAAINYAHGWLDTGSKLGIFEVKDSQLFVV